MKFYQKYNFVFLLPANADYYSVMFFDLHNCLNVRFISMQGIFNKNGQLQIRFEPFRSSLNPYVFKNPIANIDFKDYFNRDFSIGNPIIFWIFPEFYNWMKPIKYFDYLRTYYPDCKLILSLTNPVHTYQKMAGMFISEKNVQEIKSDFDCIVTYNKNDAVNLGLTHYTGFYSILPLEKQQELYDVFFVGAAKDRLDTIHRYYEYFTENGLKCDFWVTNVPPELQKFPDIHYNRKLSYLEVLEHVMRSKGVLEVAQSGTYGLTMRFFEAFVYDKNFITDNGFLNQEKFSSPKLFYIPPYSKLNIDREKYLAAAKLSNNYKGEYSPVRYLNFLEALFNAK